MLETYNHLRAFMYRLQNEENRFAEAKQYEAQEMKAELKIRG